MPIDDYKMSIQAKPMYGSIAKTDSDGGLVKIVRPLGRVRKQQKSSFSLPRAGSSLPRANKIDNGYMVSERSDVGLNSQGETTKRESSDFDETEDFGSDNFSLPQMSRSRVKVFENQYKIASKQNNESVKPAKLYNKKVIYLPMFRVHVETYVGTTEDNKAVETTRQSLKKIIDNGRRRAGSSTRLASASIKSYNFVSPGKDGSLNSLRPATPKRLLHTERSFISSPRTSRLDPSDYEDSQYFTKTSGSISDDADKMDVQFESLELRSIDDQTSTDPDNFSTVSSKAKLSFTSNLNELGSARKERPFQIHSLSDPYRAMRGETINRTDRMGWTSFDDIKKMKQKLRWQKNAHRQMERDIIHNAPRPKQEVQKWVNIHYEKPTKPAFTYASQPHTPKLDPIIVPSHTCDECPMCTQEMGPWETTVPPNSPSNGKFVGGWDHSRFSSQRQSVESNYKNPPSQNSVGRDSCLTSRSNQSSRNEAFVIPKVTVKVLDSRAKLEEAKQSFHKTNS